MFQIDPLSLSNFCDIDENDQDEWDLLSDEILQKTIRDDPQLQLKIDDRVKVIDG